MHSPETYKRAVIDWIVAHGTPDWHLDYAHDGEAPRAMLAVTGIDYEASIVGDLGDQELLVGDTGHTEWVKVPGVWAQVKAVGAWGPTTWMVRHQEREPMTLDVVIRGVIEAAKTGEAYWRNLVTDDYLNWARKERAERESRRAAYEASKQGRAGGRTLGSTLP